MSAKDVTGEKAARVIHEPYYSVGASSFHESTASTCSLRSVLHRGSSSVSPSGQPSLNHRLSSLFQRTINDIGVSDLIYLRRVNKVLIGCSQTSIRTICELSAFLHKRGIAEYCLKFLSNFIATTRIMLKTHENGQTSRVKFFRDEDGQFQFDQSIYSSKCIVKCHETRGNIFSLALTQVGFMWPVLLSTAHDAVTIA